MRNRKASPGQLIPCCRRYPGVHPCELLLLILLGTCGCTGLRPSMPPWSTATPFAEEAPVGSAKWWKKNKSRAKFEVGKGYQVAGVDGYFDQDGRPMERPVERKTLEKKSEGILPALDPQVSYNRMKEVAGYGPNEQTAREKFDNAEQLFADGKYSKAASEYLDAAHRWPRSSLAENSLFMVGESHFFDNDYPEARDSYESLVEKYPNTRHLNTVVDRMWQIGQFWEREHFDDKVRLPLAPNPLDGKRPGFDTVGHAIKTYEWIRLNDPTGPRADDAIMATAGIYFRRDRYEDADYHYTLLREEYPRSDFQFEAHLLGLQSKLRMYQGPDYDGAALKDAQRLAKRLKTQFAGRLTAEERERLRTVQAELNLQIAQRDFAMAEYFMGKKHYGSARTYLKYVIDKYPESELATLARQKLSEISDEPDTPPKRLAWFVELFPESRERTRVARIPELQHRETRVAQAPSEPAPSSSGVVPASADTTR